ncbi:Undecaprenyl-phosphate 4-deoxy-4-formamido-L-arabinose transferase [Poriferisphaera corsica]|uniref:Undecaprenyl-phosphate 4-deoxy-4-formamido-L-arabinose transferase n=1 Tax=Poriferisphaera corsica TaxID=2528020 RepID=A0A517YWD3_9BACT|nr:glycosyltransferase [Poriferisphaera corsica]QDU34519.1 Undecaprenyl-phosphate 4-deoxy-4-formamido-L-arabinose transferase [Poriferisphaera corsica]
MSDNPNTNYDLSIVIPALNEQDNVEPLVSEVENNIRGKGINAELVYINDGSTDQTLPNLKALQQSRPWLVILHRDKPQGQSSAMFAGIQAASAPYVATLDADLQNDPADLTKMYQMIQDDPSIDMVQGDRSRNRQDNIIRKVTSLVGRKMRLLILGDKVRDTGCSGRVLRSSIAKQYPLQYKGVHRFLPAYANMLGAKVVELEVVHRARVAGETKYGFGILTRGWSGFWDLFAVRWMFKRHRDTSTERMTSN